MTDSRLHHRLLESNLFGVPVSGAHVDSAASAEEIVDAFSQQPAGLLVVRVPATDLKSAQCIERAGGQLCDVLLTMRKRFSPASLAQSHEAPGMRVRPSGIDDADQIRTIAGRAFTGFRGHWHTDPRIPRDLADLLYARWAEDLARNHRANARMFVATTPLDEVMGFLALAADTNDHWSVPLTAVDTAFQGRGVLRALLDFGARDVGAQAQIQLSYETQITNIAALRSVASLGLVPAESRLTFHIWSANT